MQIPEGLSNESSRRAFLKQTFAWLFVPKKFLQLSEVTVDQLVLSVRKNIQSELLWWFLENECEWDFFSLILLKNAQIDLKIPLLSDDTITARAQSFLESYDSDYALLDEGSDLTEASKSARKVSRFLASMVDYYEEKDEGVKFTGVKKIINWKRKKILEALKTLPPRLWKTLQRHDFWIDGGTTSHLEDFQKQFLVEILWNDESDEVLTEQNYQSRLKEIEPLLEDIVANERPPGHYHDRYIFEERIKRGTEEYSSGKWWFEDFQNVPKFLQAVSAILSEKS